jgi:N-acetyl-gamma-glutamyl-phosphate reductase
MNGDRLRIGVLGASGYTGADLMRLLLFHPAADLRILTADRHAGQRIAEVYPHLAGYGLPTLISVGDADWSQVDVVFCGLPHGTTQEIIAGLPERLKIIDLSADFRLQDPATYAEWYGHEHKALDLQKQAAYGLTELNRDAVRAARLVACPGCYPTAVLLALTPVVEAGLVDPDDLVIDAKSGVSGAGRSVKQANLFCEVAEGCHPYGVAKHRHAPEIEQQLGSAAGRPVTVSFTPHLVPMNRGELVTCYVRMTAGQTVTDLRAALEARYAGEPFVDLLPPNVMPATRHVRGSNRCLIGTSADRIAGRAIIVAAIDNLVKGSSGQAIQNMNVMFDTPETVGLEQVALFP